MPNPRCRNHALVSAALLLGACSNQVNPRDDAEPYEIPPGVSVKPQRTAPATGGLQVEGQDSATAQAATTGRTDTTAAVTGDTTPGIRQ